MHNVFLVLMLISLAAVLGVLVTGIVGMVKGGEFNKKYGNKLMRARVMLQGLTLIFFALAYLSR
ncbi:MAG: twin transmembrane helix small protein [Alphaproteobacteria bacterium]|nr:twin transmembrane helix small protein [Alphaproteobacteria bacterium]